jgi:hypothetical protein
LLAVEAAVLEELGHAPVADAEDLCGPGDGDVLMCRGCTICLDRNFRASDRGSVPVSDRTEHPQELDFLSA